MSLVTACLLATILISAPCVLGAARLWFELPLLVLVAVLMLIQGLRLKAQPVAQAVRQVDAIDFAVIAFVLYTIVRWFISPSEYNSRLEAINVMAYATIFLTCRYGLVRRTHALIILYLLVILGAGETVFGYYLSKNPDFFPFGVTEQLQLFYAPRWVGTYGCPDHYACLLVMAAGAALVLGSFSKLSWPLRIVAFYLAGLIIVGLIFSGSRGGWLGLLASILALVIFGIRYGAVRWWMPVAGAVLLISVLIAAFSLSPLVHDRIERTFDLVNEGRLYTDVRVQLTMDALRIAQDHPFFGTGPGTFVFIHPRYQGSTFTNKAILTHDDYLNCLDDYGLVGIGIVMFFIWAITLKFFQPMRADLRWQDRVLVASGLSAWFALLVHSFVDFNFHIPANALLFFGLVGLGLGRLRDRDRTMRHWSTLSLVPLGPWVGWALVVLAVGYGVVVGQAALGAIVYDETYTDSPYVATVQSIAGAEKALQFDPKNVQAMVLLGDLYRYRASREQNIEGRISEGQKALDAYQAAIKVNSLDDTVQGRMGMTFDVMRRYSEAYFCYQLAATAQPYNGQFWNALGNHFWQRGFLEKAEQAYLLAAKCPHGFEGSADAAAQVRTILAEKGIPEPVPGTNPLAPQPEYKGPATTP